MQTRRSLKAFYFVLKKLVLKFPNVLPAGAEERSRRRQIIKAPGTGTALQRRLRFRFRNPDLYSADQTKKHI